MLLSCDRKHVVANVAANPCMSQSLSPTAKATPCCLPKCCFCGKNDNRMPLTQTQCPAILLKFYSETSGDAGSTWCVVPSVIGQVCLLKGLTQNSYQKTSCFAGLEIQTRTVIDPKLNRDRPGARLCLSRKKKSCISECLQAALARDLKNFLKRLINQCYLSSLRVKLAFTNYGQIRAPKNYPAEQRGATGWQGCAQQRGP